MTELLKDPAVIKLVEFATKKKHITYEEITDFLPESITNSDKIEELFAYLEQNHITVDEETAEPEPEREEPSKKKIVYNEKETSLDDPIRLYLREIGKENLLTAEQEVILSKQMEEGENIIKKVIQESGMILPEFYLLAQRAFSKKDPREMNLSKKGISDLLAERRRLNAFYR
jgi:RNA polymerase primary sigma factor